MSNNQRELMLESFASSVRKGNETIHSIVKSCGSQIADEVQVLLAWQGFTPSTQRLIMEHQRLERAQRRELVKKLRALGVVVYSPDQAVFNAIIRAHLNSCEAGTYSTANATATAVVGADASKMLRKTSKSKLNRALKQNTDHPGMKRVRSVAERSAITAATSGTVSNCLGALTNHHMIAVRLSNLEQDNASMKLRVASLEARQAAMEVRHDIEDQGSDWRTKALSIRAVEPGIANRALARRVGVHESSIRKYLKLHDKK